MRQRDFKGIFIPRDIWDNPLLTGEEKALWAEIDSFYESDACGSTISVRELAQLMGISTQKTGALVRKLVKMQLIHKEFNHVGESVMNALVPSVASMIDWDE